MTNQRWRVVKASAPTSSGKIWQVWQANQRRKVLHTWREAMDYADRKARTVEVTLPKDATTDLPAMRTKPSADGVLVEWRNGGRWEGMRITRSELEPFALALLAHHHKNQDTP